jgi:beta-N-acetylglucosaminidase
MTGPQNEQTTAPERQPHSRGHFPVEILALAAILISIGGLCTVYAWLHQNWFIAEQDRLPESAAEAVVERGSELIGLKEPASAWRARLISGEASLADYLLRLFVSPEYLARNPDDQTFVIDASLALTGIRLNDAERTAAENRLATAGSRLVYLNGLLAGEGYSSRIPLANDQTRLRTLTMAGGRPAAGTEIVGLLPITAEARLTGRNASLKIYSDGQVRVSVAIDTDDPTVQNTYALEWDTRQEQPGSHRLAFLVLTGDGRGSWQELETYAVPSVTVLRKGQALSGWQGAASTSWYQLPTQEGNALLTVVGADRPLDLQLMDLHRQNLCSTLGLAGQTAALRGRTADADSYVRIQTGTGGDANYQLVAALAAAAPLEEPKRLLGVLQVQDQKILVQDEKGAQSWQDSGKYLVYNPTGRLARLELTLPDGRKAEIAGAFDSEDTQYGLYVTAETSRLQLAAAVMEGSAASLQIEMTAETGGKQILQPGQAIPLALSENRLRLVVSAFDGSQRTYDVSILRPPHSGGYQKTLEQFPFDYRSPLWLMHVQRPAWQFVAAPAGVSWTAFITAQDYKDRSLVSANSSPASWIEPGSPVYDGKSWKAATTRVIAYFADPRNFLNSVDVFQFEKLAYDAAAHTVTGLDNMFLDTFMVKGNAMGIDFASVLIDAGEQAGISPYYLASRIIQEMGRKGESALASGTLADYEGYYNYYNIGSTPNTAVPNGMVINGARFAKYGREADKGVITEDEKTWLLPWTTPQKAIIGGAIWIARSYVQIGQDTLYLQKFDLVKDGGYYNHQYATNIQMAWSEARNTRKAYSNLGLLDQAFIFQIPVFADLPAQATTLPEG